MPTTLPKSEEMSSEKTNDINNEIFDLMPLTQIVNVHRSITDALSNFISEAKSQLNASQLKNEHLTSLLKKHRFLRSVCHFHMLSEEEVLFPVLDQSCSQCELDHISESIGFEQLGRLLSDVRSRARRGSQEAYEILKRAVDSAEKVKLSLDEHMTREETEIFPLLQQKLCYEQQCTIFWKTLSIMPLRLLERVMPWLAGRLDEKEYNQFLKFMRLGGYVTDGVTAVRLLSKWADRGFKSHHKKMDNNVVPGDEDEVSNGYPCLYENETCETKLLKSKDKLNVQETKKIGLSDEQLQLLNSQLDKTGHMGSYVRELPTGPSPIDHIFQFHEALKRHFRQFENETMDFVKFTQSSQDQHKLKEYLNKLDCTFTFLWSIYKAHSKNEDEVVFPELESKEALVNICHSYVLDHEKEENLFKEISETLTEIKENMKEMNISALAVKLSRKCAAVRAELETHVRAEENELWPLFAEHFTFAEQQKLVGAIIGRTGADVLQTMMNWVSAFITPEEVDFMMESLKKVTKNTMFETWVFLNLINFLKNKNR